MIQLSYPWALLALLSIPVIFILYSLRPQRRRQLISTVSLWREALREHQRGLGLQKLLRDLSLILLLLIALVLSLGLAGPQWLTQSSEKRDTVLVLDVSASMKAGARFSEALHQAHDLVAGLPRDGRMAIMSSGRNPVLRSAFESNRETLHRALARIEPTDEAGRPRAALALALSLLRNRAQGRIYFLSDAAFDDDVDFGSPLIEYRTVGSDAASRNIAITRFDFRPEIGTQDRFQMLLTVRNYTDEAITVPARVTLEYSPLFEQDLLLPPEDETTIVLPLRGRAVGRAQASIEFDDDLAADNQAYAVMAVDEGLRVLLISRGNFYLESVLKALPGVRLSKLDAVPSDDFALRRYDLVVLDGSTPDQTTTSSLPSGNYLLINTVPPGLPFRANGSVTQPLIAGKSSSSLLRQVDLTGLKIDAAQRVVIDSESPGLQRLFWSKETALALALLQDERRLVYLGFDLMQSNFPLQAAFPLFISQSLSWLYPRAHRFASTQLAAGEAFPIKVPATATSVIIGTPSGTGLILKIDPDNPSPLRFDATSEAGIYQYRVAGIERYFAVNLSDERESDIRPRAVLPERQAGADETGAEATKAQVVIALWPYLLGAALVLLTLEWCLWCARRGSA